MDPFGAASATAMVRSRSEDLLRAAAAVLPKTGDDFLPAVVEQAALALKAEVVMVGEYAGTDRVRTVARSKVSKTCSGVDTRHTCITWLAVGD